MRRSAFGNLSGLGASDEQHAIDFSDSIEDTLRNLQALRTARKSGSCARALAIMNVYSRMVGHMEAHMDSHSQPDTLSKRYEEILEDYFRETSKTIAACAKR